METLRKRASDDELPLAVSNAASSRCDVMNFDLVPELLTQKDHFSLRAANWLILSPPPLKSPLSLTFPQCSGQLKDTFWWKTQRLPPSTGTRECSGASYSAGAQLPTLLTDSGPAVSSAVIDPAPQNRPLRALLHLRFKGSLIRTAFLILQE